MREHTTPVAIVTGAAKRLGRRIALMLAENGYSVVVHFNRSKSEAGKTVRLIREHGGVAVAIQADLTKVRQIDRLMTTTTDRFGRIDLLVNNAATFQRRALFSVTEDDWDRTFDTNLKSCFFSSQMAGRQMMKQKHGRIINISSVGAFSTWENYLPYTISKNGVVSLTRSLARILAPHVMVNAIAPGSIVVPGEEGEGRTHIPLQKIPLGRYGSPDDITSLVLYLATTAQYITGQTISVDGGRSLL